MTTFNQATLIGATLETIITQVTSDCEIVILDGASSDDTERVVSVYAQRCENLRYIKQVTNGGPDCDLDRTVELARGKYCWLMCSDDLMKPGAVAAVLPRLSQDYSMIVVGMEIRDFSLSTLLARRRLDFDADRIYGPRDMDRLFREAWGTVSHISCKIIKRSIWLARDRERYYGALYMHLAVVFQEPLPGETLVMVEPLICHRFGKQVWRPRAMEMVARWQTVVDSFCLTESTKRELSVGPRMTFSSLLLWRAFGVYSLLEYQRWVRPRLHSIREIVAFMSIAFFPRVLLNTLLTLCYSTFPNDDRRLTLQMLKDSPFYVGNLHWVRSYM
jgi:glycosyltransferase involved in cell wall biosynthesis